MDNALYPGQIVVKSAVVDDGGDYGAKLKVVDTAGKPYTVNEKHKALWPVFQDNIGKTIILNWNTWQGRTYIEKAQVMITAADVQKPVAPIAPQPIQQPVQSFSKPVPPIVAPIPQTPIRSTNESIEMQVALKALTELGVAKLLDIVTYDALVAKLSKMAGLAEFIKEIESAKPALAKAVKK